MIIGSVPFASVTAALNSPWSGRWEHWRTLPAEYGPRTTLFNRINGWSQKGIWQGLLAALAASADPRRSRWWTAPPCARTGRRSARRLTPPPCDPGAYRARNLIERAFCRRKDWRGIATLYDKTACNFLAGNCLAVAITDWLR